MTDTNTNITVSIAKLGTSIQEVEVPTGSNVMAALRKANFNLDGVVSVKRNGTVVSLDIIVSAGDVLLVSMEKIKGGADEEEVVVNTLMLGFTIQKENQPELNNGMMFEDSMTTWDIIRQVMSSRGQSINNFKELQDEEGAVVSLETKLTNNGAYKIITCAEENCEEDED
jgi:sulfur carrier protein ThiS